jgi:hypothetical protein
MNTSPQIVWRQEYEPFKGHVYCFGHYEIRPMGAIWQLWHGGQRIMASKDWSACDEYARTMKGEK